MDEKEKPQKISLEEWGKELDEEIASFNDILSEEPSFQEKPLSSSFQEKLKSFIQSKSKILGEEILSDCRELSLKATRQSQIYLGMLEKLTKALLRFENVSELFTIMIDKLPLIFSSEIKPSERENLIQKFYMQYQDLKLKSSSLAFSEGKSDRLKETGALVGKIVEAVNAKLHEINIKIEENQRTLHRLLASYEKTSSPEQAYVTPPETLEISEMEEKSFYLIDIAKKKFILPTEVVVNMYKISPKKAKKLAQKFLIRFGQIGTFFNLITKRLKGELKEKEITELKNTFLNVLQPETNTLGKYNAAVIVRIPDVENYGVIFVNQPLRKTIKGKIREDRVETSEGNFPILNVKSTWLKKQVEYGLV